MCSIYFCFVFCFGRVVILGIIINSGIYGELFFDVGLYYVGWVLEMVGVGLFVRWFYFF